MNATRNRCSLETFDPDQFHDPEFRNPVRTARAVIAERVRRGIATPAERLVIAALDEMPDEEHPDAVRAWAPSVPRSAMRCGIVEALADEADRDGGGGETMH